MAILGMHKEKGKKEKKVSRSNKQGTIRY